MNAKAATCPPSELLSAFGLGKLDAGRAETVHQHLETCVDCRRIVASVSGERSIESLRGEQQAAQVSNTSNPPQPSDVKQQASRSLSGKSESIVRHASETIAGRGQSFAAPSPEPLIADANLAAPPELANHPDYELLKELGRGGMGVVYLARNRMLDRLEVLKVVSRSLLDRPGALERFQQEIRAAARLQHPNIVAAYNALRIGELLVLAMEYVPGEDLSQLIARRGALPVVNAAFYAQQAALGLQHAHEKGLVHRDIKPNNLILAKEGKRHIVKILDFGLAKATSEKQAEGSLTRTGQMLGTPDYVAPEQMLDAQKADIRADIYSLGCTLYYLLAGRPPFEGNSLYEILQSHHVKVAPPLNELRPEVPAELAAVVSYMMAKRPDERYQTPGDVAKALLPFFNPGATKAKQATSMPPTPQGLVTSALPAGMTPLAAASVASVQSPMPHPGVAPAAAIPTSHLRGTSASSGVFNAKRLSKTTNSTRSKRARRKPPRTGSFVAISIGVAGIAALLWFRLDHSILQPFDDRQTAAHEEGSRAQSNSIDVPDGASTSEPASAVRSADKPLNPASEPALKTTSPAPSLAKSDSRVDVTASSSGRDFAPSEPTSATKPGNLNATSSVSTLPSDQSVYQSSEVLKFSGSQSVKLRDVYYHAGDPITFEAFVTPDSNGAIEQTIIGNCQHSGVYLSIERGHWEFGVHGASAYSTAVSDAPPLAGVKSHVAGVLDGKKLSLFVNGKQQARSAVLAGIHRESTRPFFIGADPNDQNDPEHFFHGVISDVRISSTARYLADFAPPVRVVGDPVSVAVLPLREGKGDIAFDASGNHRDGRINNAQWIRVERTTPSAVESNKPASAFDEAPPSHPALTDGWVDILDWAAGVDWAPRGIDWNDNCEQPPTKDGITLKWQKPSRFPLPAIIDGDYEMEVEFTRHAGNEGVALCFPVGIHNMRLGIGSYGGTIAGVSWIDGKPYRDGNSTTQRPCPIANGQRHRILLRANHDRDRASIKIDWDDAKDYITWQGPYASLTNSDGDGLGLSMVRHVWLTAWEGRVTFHAVRVRMTSGTVRRDSITAGDRQRDLAQGLVRLIGSPAISPSVEWGQFVINQIPLEHGPSDDERLWPLISREFSVCREFYGAHAPSRLNCPVPRGAKSFTAVGYNHNSRSVKYIVSVDGREIYDSGVTGIALVRVAIPTGSKTLELVVDPAGSKDLDQSYWCYPRFYSTPIEKVTEKTMDGKPGPLKFSIASHTVGVGDLTNNAPIAGTNTVPIELRDAIPCDEFILAHAISTVSYTVPMGMTRFTAIGYCVRSQHVKYQVWADGKMVYESPIAGIIPIDVRLPLGTRTIKLRVDDLGPNNWDMSMWCYPRLSAR